MTEMRAFAASRHDIAVVLVDVLDERGLARWVAKTFEIPHESPQVLVFREGTVAWHASHGHVEAAALQRETAPSV